LEILIVACFAAVVLTFVTATAYEQHRASAIERTALIINADAVPGVRHLAAARSDILRMPFLVEDVLQASPGGSGVALSTVLRTRQQIEDEIDAYLALPVYPGETEQWRQSKTALPLFDRAIEETLAGVAAGDDRRAWASLGRIEQTAQRLGAAVNASVSFNVEQAGALAHSIEGIRRRAFWWAWALDATSAALAIVAVTLSLRAVRGHTRLLNKHNDLLQRRADELEQFAGRIAHDLVNPLATVSMSLDALDTGDAGVRERTVARVRRAVAQMRSLIDGLLGFARAGARPEAGARAAVRATVADVLATFRAPAQEVGAELVVGPLPEGDVSCSPGALTSVLSNLVANALKHAAPGGGGRVEVRGRDSAGGVLLEVSDSGPGLPPELDPESVFEPYVRGRGGRPGIGLGLSTVKRVVEGHGGRVGVHTSGAGCTFWVELRRAEISATPIPALAPAAHPPG
jgi:signal transduction histidine kinase